MTIANTLPRWLSKAHPVAVTPKAATTQTVRVYLAPKSGLAALQAKVADLTSPGSAHYGQWLTSAQFAASYAPTAAAARPPMRPSSHMLRGKRTTRSRTSSAIATYAHG